MRIFRITWELISATVECWGSDDAPQLAAAIAYYTIFSIPPLLIIILAITSYFLNTNAAQNQLIEQIVGFTGQQTADFLKSLLENTRQTPNGPLASLISFFVLLAGASGIFYQLQHALNKIWEIPQKQNHGFLKILQNRFLSFLMVFGIGFLLIFFLFLSAIFSIIIGYFNGNGQNEFLPQAINFLVLFSTITILFAMVYRVVPDKEITWTDVWLGASVTALLFLLGRYAIGLYLSFNTSASTFGAAGSLIVLLIWVNYSAQIFLLGAEFTHVYSRQFGSHSSNVKTE